MFPIFDVPVGCLIVILECEQVSRYREDIINLVRGLENDTGYVAVIEYSHARTVSIRRGNFLSLDARKVSSGFFSLGEETRIADVTIDALNPNECFAEGILHCALLSK